MVVGDVLAHLQRRLEVRLGLARKADDQVRGQRDVGHGFAQRRDELQIARARVATVHPLQDAVAARLQRQMEPLADLGTSRMAAIIRGVRLYGLEVVKRMRASPSTSFTRSS